MSELQVWSASAEAIGFAPFGFETTVRAGCDLDLGDIPLEPGGTITVHVIDEGGLPVNNLEFVARDPNDPRLAGGDDLGPFLPGRPKVARRDSAGRFLVSLAPGSHQVWFASRTTRAVATKVIHLRAGELVDIGTIVLPNIAPSEIVSGVVRELGGKPLEGMAVGFRAVENLWCSNATCETDSDGRFVFAFAPREEYAGAPSRKSKPGTVTLAVNDPAERFAPAIVSDVRPGTRDLEVTLEPFRHIQLRVVDEEGWPVENFTVAGSGRLEQRRFWPGGLADLLVPRGPFKLTVRSGTNGERTIDDLNGRTMADELQVVLQSFSSIRGVVLHAGQPVAGARVAAFETYPWDQVGDVLPDLRMEYVEDEYAIVTHTDEQGRFRLGMGRNTRPYPVLVRAWAQGLSQAIAGPVKAGGEVELELCEAGAVEGRVRLREDQDPRSIEAVLQRGDPWKGRPGTTFLARLDEEGRFRLDGIPRGPWHLTFVEPEVRPPTGTIVCSGTPATCSEKDPRFVRHLVQVRPGEATHVDLDLRNDELCRLRGMVRVEGEPQPGGLVYLWVSDCAYNVDLVEVARDGTFELAVRNPGTYRIVWRGGEREDIDPLVTDLVELVPGITLWEPQLSQEAWRHGRIALDKHGSLGR